MDVKLHQQLLTQHAFATLDRHALAPHVSHRQVYQEVVVGLAHLQKTLTALYVFHQVRSIAPDAVRRTHIYRGIEFPAWPCVVLWRVARTVEVDVVDTTGEHQVQVGLHLR